MKTRLILLILTLSTALLSRASDKDIITWFDSPQHNQWKESPYFVEGLDVLKNGGDDDIDRAIALFDQELQQHPANGYAMCNMAVIEAVKVMMHNYDYNSTDDPDSLAMRKQVVDQGLHRAIDRMESGRQLIPAADSLMQANAWVWMAMLHKSCHFVNSFELSHCLEKALEYRHDALLYKEIIEISAGDPDKCERYARQALALSPENRDILEIMILITKRKGDIGEMMRYCEHYFALMHGKEDMIDSEIIEAYAHGLAQTGNGDKAIDFVLDNMKNDYTLLFQALSSIDADPDLALAKIGQRQFAQEGNPSTWSMLSGVINGFMKRDYRTAIGQFKEAEGGVDAHGWNQCMSYCYYMLGDVPSAIAHTQAADYLSGSNHVLQLQESLGMIDPLITNLNTKLALSDVYEIKASDYAALGKCHLLKSCPELALEPLSKAVNEADYSLEGALYRAMALTDVGRGAEATRQLEEIAEIVGNNSSPDQRLIKAQACAMLGRDAEARSLLEGFEKAWSITSSFESNVDNEGMPSCYELAATWAMLGNETKVLEWMTRHFDYDFMPYNFGFMALDRRFDKVKDNAELRQLVEKKRLQWLNQQ